MKAHVLKVLRSRIKRNIKERERNAEGRGKRK
jgi:hypothetical protein